MEETNMKPNKAKNVSHNSKPLGKNAVKAARAGVPLDLKLIPGVSEGEPFLIDPDYCGKSYHVKNGEIYTVRLGIHSDPKGIGTITRDSIVACSIPTEQSKNLQIMALFAFPEIQPTIFMDCVNLQAGQLFTAEYVYHSAVLQANNNSKGLVLSDDAVQIMEDMVLISHDRLKGELPKYCNFVYDFISFQVKIRFI